MIEQALVVTRDSTLYEQVQNELVPFDGQALCKSVGPRIATVARLRSLINAKAPGLIIIDASTSSDDKSADGESGKAVLQFLRELREDRSRIPAIVLLTHRMEEIESHCASSKFDYDLNIDDIGHDSIDIALQRLKVVAGEEDSHDYAIEIIVERGTWNVELLRDGKSVRKKNSFNLNPARMTMYANDFRKWKMLTRNVEDGRTCMRPPAGWQSYFRAVGETLYRDLIVSLLSDDLEDIQRTRDGLQRTYVRFHVPNDLFAVPFEALYDANADRFLCTVSPIVRRVSRESPIRGPNDRNVATGDLNVLFVKAQVEGMLKLVDDSDRSVSEEQWFDPLCNLDGEEAYFQTMKDKLGKRGRGTVSFLTQPAAGLSFAETLEDVLKGQHYDFVHFAGHSFTTTEGSTLLILPSPRPDRVVGLPVESFARWAGRAGVRFAYLSSCRGGSWEGVRTMVDNGVPQVLGFRWDVEDDKAARFAQIFYERLLDRDESFVAAYRDACEALHTESKSANPIWASPVMIIQNDDWWHRAAGQMGFPLSQAA
jgi:hypothetical protein